MKNDIKKTEDGKPEANTVIPKVPDKSSIPEKLEKEKYSPEQKKTIAKIKSDMKEKGITKTLHSELGVIKIGGKK
jgi:hypothetical protein